MSYSVRSQVSFTVSAIWEDSFLKAEKLLVIPFSSFSFSWISLTFATSFVAENWAAFSM